MKTIKKQYNNTKCKTKRKHQKGGVVVGGNALMPKFLDLPEDIPTPPKDQTICIIVPHRNRIDQLKEFLTKMKTLRNTDIYVIDQNNGDKFNRGLLLNIGFLIASKKKQYDRYIFHDVDSYPDATLKRQYLIDCNEYKIVHYASPHLGYKYSFAKFFGGVVGFTKDTFEKINGFPNNIFGWGAEDDIMRQRVVGENLPVYRPIKGRYILADHENADTFELSYHNNKEKWAKIMGDKTNSKKNGVHQLKNFYITLVEMDNFREFFKNYNIQNAYYEFSLLGDYLQTPDPHRKRDDDIGNVYFFKIDFLAQHILKKQAGSVSYMDSFLHKNYIRDEKVKNLSQFKGNPIFYKNDKKSPLYNHLEPLLKWEDIEERILGDFIPPKRVKIPDGVIEHPELRKLVIEPQISQYENHLTKTDLKNTLKFVFSHFNEFIYFRVRGGKLTHKFFVFNVGNPVMDWYQDLQWGEGGANHANDADEVGNGAKLKELQKFVERVQPRYYLTLAKPHNLRANGCLLNVENTLYMRELKGSYVKEFIEMMEYTVSKYKDNLPDCDLIINRKDFAYLNRDNTYYNHLLKLKHNKIENPPPKWFPIFCQSKTPKNLDITIPSADEWKALQNEPSSPLVEWKKRKSVGFFRGSSTGCGTNIENNTRLKFANISMEWNKMEDKKGILDVGISKLTKRFKAFEGSASFIDSKILNPLLGKFVDSKDQMNYKYIFNIAGNAQAYRFPTEFYKGSVILNVESEKTPYMWFFPLLKDGVDYIRIWDINENQKKQEKEIYDKVKKLIDNDEKAHNISVNGLLFAKKYINREVIAEYWFQSMIAVNERMTSGTHKHT